MVVYITSTVLFFLFLNANEPLVTILCEDRPKPFHFAIVDEVDSVLIDEGRNPLLISGEVSLILNFGVVAHILLQYLGCQCSNNHFNVEGAQ